jgi:hypothetical protein
MSGCLSGMDGWENAVDGIGYFARQTTFIPVYVFPFSFCSLSLVVIFWLVSFLSC